MAILGRQPFKFLYFSYFVTTFFVKIPLWMFTSLRRSQRPRPSWSIGRCLCVYILRSAINLPLTLGDMRKRSLSKEVSNSTLKNAKFAWVNGIEESILIGDVQGFAEKAGVKPMQIPGYWQIQKDSWTEWAFEAREGEKVAYHLHGGAFYLGSAHPSDMTACIPRGILEHSSTITRTFAVDYRKCASAPFPVENPFPAALLDVIAGYQYLINLGFRPENIFVIGDSAGGNLALALIRYLKESGLTQSPGKLLLLSPWGDLSSSRTGPSSSRVTNMKSDIFPIVPTRQRDVDGYGVTSYIGTALDREETKTNKYLSPASEHLEGMGGMFSEFPRTYVLAGGAERILDDSKVLAERLTADNRDRKHWVTLDVVEDAVHDFCAFSWHEPERTSALERMSRWIDQD